MAKCKLLMSTAQVQKLIDFLMGMKMIKLNVNLLRKQESKLKLNVKQN